MNYNIVVSGFVPVAMAGTGDMNKLVCCKVLVLKVPVKIVCRGYLLLACVRADRQLVKVRKTKCCVFTSWRELK